MTEVGFVYLSLCSSITILQALFCFSCDFYLRTVHLLQYKPCLLPLGFESEDLVPKAGVSQLWSGWFPISTYKRSEHTATAQYPLQTSAFSAGTTVAV